MRYLQSMALSLVLAGCPLAAGAQPDHLRILVEDAAEPFSNPDGSGYANDIVRAAFAAVGVKAELVVVPYARCKALVLAGVEVACFSMSHEPGLEGTIQFAQQPLFSVTPVYFQNRRRLLPARREEELGRGAEIGVVNGYEYPESVAQARDRGATLVAARSDQINLKKLAAGRIDAALVMDSVLHSASRQLQQAGVADAVVATFSSSRLDSYIGFSTRHPRGELALAEFNRGYALIMAGGQQRKIADKWNAAK